MLETPNLIKGSEREVSRFPGGEPQARKLWPRRQGVNSSHAHI